MIELKYGKKYKLKDPKHLYRYKIDDKVRSDAISTLSKKKIEFPDAEFHFALIGSEHNYKWLKEQYKLIPSEQERALSFLKQLLEIKDITQEEYDTKYQSLNNTYEHSDISIKNSIKEYEEYYKEYGTYDIIMFYINSK